MSERPDTTTSEQASAPRGVDVTVPHSARMYDWWIGGKDNFPADREMGRAFMRVIPNIREMARENRSFMQRVTRYLSVEAGITQFLDIGTGIPTKPNVHEIAQGGHPESRVVYVDNDPIVLTHARALLKGGRQGRTAYIDADVREPEKILADPALRETLDLDSPVGLLLIAVLMLVDDDVDPWADVRTLMDALPSGSYLAVTHPGRDFDPKAVGALVDAATAGGMTFVPRVRDEVARFFDGLDLVEPGVVPVADWRPDETSHHRVTDAYYWGGLARKP